MGLFSDAVEEHFNEKLKETSEYIKEQSIRIGNLEDELEGLRGNVKAANLEFDRMQRALSSIRGEDEPKMKTKITGTASARVEREYVMRPNGGGL